MTLFKRAFCAATLSLGLILSGAALAADINTGANLSPPSPLSVPLQTQDYVQIMDEACGDYVGASDACINTVYQSAMGMSSDLMGNSSITIDRDNFDERLRNGSHFDICVRHREFSYGPKYGPRPFMNQAEFCLDEAAKINDYYGAAYNNQMVEDVLERVRKIRHNNAKATLG